MMYYKNIINLIMLLTTWQCNPPVNKNVEFSPDNKNWVNELKSAVNNHLQKSEIGDTLFIQFAEGIYPIKESLSFTGDSSVKTNAPIVIRGADKTVFSGRLILDNKALKIISDTTARNRIINIKAMDKILEYDLSKEGNIDFGEIKCIGFGRSRGAAPRQLYINGQRMTLARYPNAGDPFLEKNRNTVIPIKRITNAGQEKVELPGNANKKDSASIERGAFVYEDDRVEKWLNSSDIWLDGIFCRDWAWSLNKVSKIDTDSKTITLEYPEKYDLTANHSFFFAANLLEEMDVPGEYFIDREKGELYFYPPKDFNPNPSTIELSGNTQTFLEFEGIENLKIENIDFELGRFNALKIDKCSNIEVVDCSFRNFGNTAIIANGENIKIEQCKIHSIGGTAIELNGGEFETLKASNNGDISNWGNYHRVYSSAVALDGVGSKLIGNKMYFSPHGAISISGNNHLISRNEISNVCLEFEDFGAIYAFIGRNQLMRGTKISHNYFHNLGLIGERVHVIYPDEATADWTIESNLFYKIGSEGARVNAIFTNTGSHLSINNNLFLDCSQTFELSFHFSTWAQKRYENYFKGIWEKQFSKIDSIPTVYFEQYPELKYFLSEERIYVNTNSFTNNIIGNFSFPLKHEGFFYTRSDLENADSLVITKGNSYTKDKSLVEFLDKWNSSKNREELKNEMPELLGKYL